MDTNDISVLNIWILYIPLSIYNSNIVISTMIGLYYLKFLDDSIYTSAFLIGMGYYYIFSSFINFKFAENIGKSVSYEFVKYNQKSSEFYLKSILLLAIFIVLFYPLFQNMNVIVLTGNHKLSLLVGEFFQKFFYVMLIIGINWINESYLMNQNKTKNFIIINIISIIILPFFCKYFILTKNYKLDGMVYSFFLKELFTLFFGWINFCYNAEFRFIKLKIVLNGFCEFTIFSTFYIIIQVCESILMKSFFLFLIANGNNQDIIIWGLIMNIIDLNHYIGSSFSYGIKKFVEKWFLEEYFVESKILIDKLLLVVTSVIVSEMILINLFSKHIASLFIRDENIDINFKWYWKFYSIFIFNDFTIQILETIFRIITKLSIQSTYKIYWMYIIQFIIGFFIIYKYGLLGAFFLYVITILLLNTWQIIFYLNFNWLNLLKINERILLLLKKNKYIK